MKNYMCFIMLLFIEFLIVMLMNCFIKEVEIVFVMKMVVNGEASCIGGLDKG